jgi:hypothetical protein
MADPGLHSLRDALTQFASASATQSGEHITTLHWHIAQRLVLEGGFLPDNITPRPPLRVERQGRGGSTVYRLSLDPSAARAGESTMLGGLKTKDVDVVVALPNIGPVLAVSVKGTLNAFRNLTNRMEEAAGDCTNIHMAYPALVYGFLHVLRGNHEGDVESRNDVAILASGEAVDSIQRYHDAMSRLTNRKDIRDDVSRYEAVALAIVEMRGADRGLVRAEFPPLLSPLRFERFFSDLLEAYDLRFVYSAPALSATTQRRVWTCEDGLMEMALAAGFQVRVA